MKRKVDDDIRQVFDRYMREYPAKVRLQHYVHQAEIRQETETKVFELQLIKELLAEAGQARQAIDSQDLDHFAQAFERVMRRAFVLKIIDFEAAIKKEQGDYVKELEAELKKRPNPSKGGTGRDIAMGYKAKRDQARSDWLVWEPEKGKRKTVAAFYRCFYKIHGTPADESRMRKWLK
jgi:hypothetical protein